MIKSCSTVTTRQRSPATRGSSGAVPRRPHRAPELGASNRTGRNRLERPGEVADQRVDIRSAAIELQPAQDRQSEEKSPKSENREENQLRPERPSKVRRAEHREAIAAMPKKTM